MHHLLKKILFTGIFILLATTRVNAEEELAIPALPFLDLPSIPKRADKTIPSPVTPTAFELPALPEKIDLPVIPTPPKPMAVDVSPEILPKLVVTLPPPVVVAAPPLPPPVEDNPFTLPEAPTAPNFAAPAVITETVPTVTIPKPKVPIAPPNAPAVVPTIPPKLALPAPPPHATHPAKKPHVQTVLPDKNLILPTEKHLLERSNWHVNNSYLAKTIHSNTNKDISPTANITTTDTTTIDAIDEESQANEQKKLLRAFGAAPTTRQLLLLNYKFQVLPDQLFTSKSKANAGIKKPMSYLQLDKLAFKTAADNNINGLRALIEEDNLLNIDNNHRENLLIYSTMYNRIDAVRLLVAKKISIDQVDKNHDTALLIAVKKGYHQIAALLLTMGADAYIKDKHGKSPLVYAREQNNQHLVRMILSSNSKPVIQHTAATASYYHKHLKTH